MVVQELGESAIPQYIKEFEPVECFDCSYDEFIPQKYFFIKSDSNSEVNEETVSKYLNAKYDIKNFNVFASDEGTYVTISKCPKCGSDNIIVDL